MNVDPGLVQKLVAPALEVCGSFLLGVEGDIQYTSFDVTRIAVSLGNTNGGPATIVPGNITESFSSRWLSTVRGRAGFTTGPVLFYATGGAAIANLRFSDQLCFPTAAIPICNTATSDETRLGWTVGGGAEFRLDRKWSMKAEYLYLNFDSVSGTSTTKSPFFGDPTTITYRHRLDPDAIHIGRIGLNYRFGGDAVVARY